MRRFPFAHGLAGFTYGNGLSHSRAITVRGLTQSLRDAKGRGAAVMDFDYTYDANGNVLTISDYTTPPPWNESRSLSYDARDRMITATAPGVYGEELYSYDPLDNVRRMAVFPDGHQKNGVRFTS